jgi:hypothetical protein
MIEIPSFVQDRKDLENNSFQQKILFVESVLGTGVKIAKILVNLVKAVPRYRYRYR